MDELEADAGAAPAPRPAHRPSRRSEIIKAATIVFSRLTYAEATVEDIAAECGVAPTAVYYHFGGKDRKSTRLNSSHT